MTLGELRRFIAACERDGRFEAAELALEARKRLEGRLPRPGSLPKLPQTIFNMERGSR
jgi:hypothetical protein